MARVTFITHPDVVIDPDVDVTRWPLNARGRARMQSMLTRPWVKTISAVFCSAEQKAIDGAQILATHLGLAWTELDALGEIDRSATGYLPHDEHAATAARCFDHPSESIRGWERAIDAQRRVVSAVDRICAAHAFETGDVAIVSHGGVGVFLHCHLTATPLSNRVPKPGVAHGGSFFQFDALSRQLLSDWQPIETAEVPLP